MNILFFDTETTGTPKNYKAPMTDLENWPRVIQLAWEKTDDSGNVLSNSEVLIKPDGWVIPMEKIWIDNGFHTDISNDKGIAMPDALDSFVTDLNECDVMVAHNMGFDHPILGAEMIRYKKRANNPARTKICTMERTVDVCKVPFPNRGRFNSKQGWKWPKLEELYQFLFNQGFEGAHQSGNDVTACRLCFFELVKRGIISLPS